MSAPAVTILSGLADGMVDAVLEKGGEDGMRALGALLERYRSAGALGALPSWRTRRPLGADAAVIDVLTLLDRDLLTGLTG